MVGIVVVSTASLPIGGHAQCSTRSPWDVQSHVLGDADASERGPPPLRREDTRVVGAAWLANALTNWVERPVARGRSERGQARPEGEHEGLRDCAQLVARTRRQERAPTRRRMHPSRPAGKNLHIRTSRIEIKFHVRAKRTRPERRATSTIVRAMLPSLTRAHFANSERQRDEVYVHFAPVKHTRTKTGAIETTFRAREAPRGSSARRDAVCVHLAPAKSTRNDHQRDGD